MSATVLPRYRARYLPAMTSAKILALPDRAWAPVVLAVGAIEQHGPHLPVAVDSYLAQVWLERIIAKLPATAPCYVAPPITLGKSNEHTGFPGTLTISKETLRLQVLAIAQQLKTWGFSQLAILNTHGGNIAVLIYTLREVVARFGLRTTILSHGANTNVPLQEATFGYHANEVETSLMLGCAESLVKMSAAVCEYPLRLGETRELRPERAAATFAWVSQDFGASGIMGDAPAATREKGEKWLDEMSTGYAQAIWHLGQKGREQMPASPSPTTAAKTSS